jgi:CheY-like chemotaxis protein/anti-sigma regulatory factor (Ser/Thr protein kinase)
VIAVAPHRGFGAAASSADSPVAPCAKSEFLVHMSHELRTPLNAILGFAQILKRDKTLDERNRFAVNTIEASGAHLLALLNDVLDLSRIESGRLELYPSSIDLTAFMQSVVDIVRVKADQKKLHVVIELAHDLPHTVHVDERRLRQVLLNLLGNAVKFTDSGHVALRVSALPQRGAGRTAQRRLHIDVEDTGVGIAADDLCTIFEPYEQAGDSTRRAGGTGLGLAISRALVQALGGEIGVESTPLAGSRFWFEIDVNVMQHSICAQGDAHEICGYLGRRRTVLIADDSIEHRAMMTTLLKSLAFETVEAGSGVEALLQAQASKPDLILMDNAMPEMTGMEAMARLRAQPQFESIPVIAISASVTQAQAQQCLESGFDVFLPKPIKFDELLPAIGALLQLDWTYSDTMA